MKKPDFKALNRKDWSNVESFQRIGITWTKVFEDGDYLVWSAGNTHPGYLNLEVWKKRWAKNPDGSEVLIAPGDSEWGRYGWSPYGKEEHVRNKLLKFFGIALP